MRFKHRQFQFQVKSISDKGELSGYGSVFGNADAYRDVVMPGAFQKSLATHKENGTSPPMLWQHSSAQPIGLWTSLAEDGTGLAVEGKLLIDEIVQAQEAFSLLKHGVIRGMSIGYDVPAGGSTYNGKTNVNELHEIDLWEISIVTFPANTDATVTAIKSLLAAGEVPTIRQFEDLLRDAGSFSRKQAEAIARGGYVKFLEQRDADRGDADSDEELFADVLASIKSRKF